MKILEPFRLLFIGIENIFYNGFLLIGEIMAFGGKLRWWRMRVLYFIFYLFPPVSYIIRRDSAKASYGEDNFVYGETPALTMYGILKSAGFSPGQSFADLGCGRGMGLLAVSMFFAGKFYGVDLINTFISRGTKIARLLKAETVSFIHDDFLNFPLEEMDLIYIAGTTFRDDFIGKMQAKLKRMKKGAWAVTLSYPLPQRHFDLIETRIMDFTWGKSHVYFHRKR